LKGVEQNARGVAADLAAARRPFAADRTTDLPDDRDAAVTALFAVHYRQLLALARRLLDDPGDAEDVVMDSFVGLYRRWAAYGAPTTLCATCGRASSAAAATGFAVCVSRPHDCSASSNRLLPQRSSQRCFTSSTTRW